MAKSATVDNFEIAPGYWVKHWKALTLDEADGSTEDWKTALAILDARIRSRFIEPAQLLINSEDGKGRGTNGFAVLAIDFLLIETIQGFKSGRLQHTGQSKALFKAFLMAWSEFTACVPADKDKESLAARVYEQGRCALHHSGSTERLIVRKTGKLFIFDDNGQIEINRSLLHQELTKAFDAYLADLKAQPNSDLRKKFVAKMNHICM